jgi:simple sugar transport system ATP-binding protein
VAFAIEMLGITKDFPGIRANDGIDLRVEEGSIHALLGENGAGKSTLMSILFGLYRQDSGLIRVRGREARIESPNDATALRIGMVHQHFKLVAPFTVAENIVLGMEPRRGPAIDMRKAEAKAAEISARYGLFVDPKSRVEDISVGMQQRVEILKMLYRDADILIFDEPTAVLTPQEILDLMAVMRRLADEGKTVILITHKLKEIKAVASICTVLRRGRVVATVPVAGTSEEEMARMMVGREVSFRIEKAARALGEKVLELRGLKVRNSRGLLAVKGLSLDVRSGEILGLCGIDGNGQEELVQAVAGLLRAEGGSILVKGRDVTRASVRQRLDAGLGLIPADRQKHGLVLDFALDENFALHDYFKAPYARFGVLDKAAIRARAERLIAEFDVRSGAGPATMARSMSGGNQQKAIVARETDRSPEAFVVSQPTRGLDVGAIEYIHKRLIAERDKGKAILLVSYELEEILGLSDRIAVIHSGEIVGLVDPAATTEEELGLFMAGTKRMEAL